MYQVRVTRMPFLRALDQFGGGLGAAGHDAFAGQADRALALLLAPSSANTRRFDDLAVLDDRRASRAAGRRRPTAPPALPGPTGSAQMLTRSSNDLLADLVAAAFLGQEAAALVGLARVEAEFIMNEIRPAAAAGSRITVYLPGSSALASAESRALCDGGARCRSSASNVGDVAEIAADPARAAAVVGAHGAGVSRALVVFW